jgi:hypothetical protein
MAARIAKGEGRTHAETQRRGGEREDERRRIETVRTPDRAGLYSPGLPRSGLTLLRASAAQRRLLLIPHLPPRPRRRLIKVVENSHKWARRACPRVSGGNGRQVSGT